MIRLPLVGAGMRPATPGMVSRHGGTGARRGLSIPAARRALHQFGRESNSQAVVPSLPSRKSPPLGRHGPEPDATSRTRKTSRCSPARAGGTFLPGFGESSRRGGSARKGGCLQTEGVTRVFSQKDVGTGPAVCRELRQAPQSQEPQAGPRRSRQRGGGVAMLALLCDGPGPCPNRLGLTTNEVYRVLDGSLAEEAS